MQIKFGKNKNLLILSVIFIGFYFFVKLTGTNAYCIFKHTIGIPCPGCGITRSWLSVFQLDFKSAFFYHPLFWLVPIFIVIGVFRSKEPFSRLYYSNAFWMIATILLVSVFAVRMILYFPDQEPMDYNSDSLLSQIFRFFFENN